MASGLEERASLISQFRPKGREILHSGRKVTPERAIPPESSPFCCDPSLLPDLVPASGHLFSHKSLPIRVLQPISAHSLTCSWEVTEPFSASASAYLPQLKGVWWIRSVCSASTVVSLTEMVMARSQGKMCSMKKMLVSKPPSLCGSK